MADSLQEQGYTENVTHSERMAHMVADCPEADDPDFRAAMDAYLIRSRGRRNYPVLSKTMKSYKQPLNYERITQQWQARTQAQPSSQAPTVRRPSPQRP